MFVLLPVGSNNHSRQMRASVVLFILTSARSGRLVCPAGFSQPNALIVAQSFPEGVVGHEGLTAKFVNGFLDNYNRRAIMSREIRSRMRMIAGMFRALSRLLVFVSIFVTTIPTGQITHTTHTTGT